MWSSLLLVHSLIACAGILDGDGIFKLSRSPGINFKDYVYSRIKKDRRGVLETIPSTVLFLSLVQCHWCNIPFHTNQVHIVHHNVQCTYQPLFYEPFVCEKRRVNRTEQECLEEPWLFVFSLNSVDNRSLLIPVKTVWYSGGPICLRIGRIYCLPDLPYTWP